MKKLTSTRWLYLLGILLLSVALAGCGGSTAQADEVALGNSANGNATTVTVVVTDFVYTLDTSQASAGTVTFIVTNDGRMPHDFAIQGNGAERSSALIEPGQSTSLTVDLKAGTYTYLCTVPGHALLGMKGTFTVT